MKQIAFFLSASDVDKKYSQPALELIKSVVKEGYGFVYGGSETGLMKQAADEVDKLHGKIIGVSSAEFQSVLRTNIDEAYVGKTINERKNILMSKSDAVIVLPGGAGTLDEITDIIEHKKIGSYTKPIVFLNTDGFWDGLLSQYDRMYEEGFISTSPSELFYIHDEPQHIVEYLKINLKKDLI